MTRIFHADTEGLEDFDGWRLAVTTAATRGRWVVLWIVAKTTSAAGGGARGGGWVAAIEVAGEEGGVLRLVVGMRVIPGGVGGYIAEGT